MQWILQSFEDTNKLAVALDELQIPYSWHKIVPFIGQIEPEPEIANPNSVVLFGAYSFWQYAKKHDLKPGVFKLRPFVHEKPWQPYMLNGIDAIFVSLRDIPSKLPNDQKSWFMRPVDDSKEEPGKVRSASDIIKLAEKVLKLDEREIPTGSLRHDTELMLTPPARIIKEWRIWVVDDVVQTFSLYKEGERVVYRQEIDDDALQFANELVGLNPNYSRAYVMDICRTEAGLKLLETNCINAAGFYAADLKKLAKAINSIDS